MPCSGKFKESECPELCLGLEVTCCFANSVVSTRYLIQDTMIVQNTECDNCLIGFMVVRTRHGYRGGTTLALC
jgi:hypothetical protein